MKNCKYWVLWAGGFILVGGIVLAAGIPMRFKLDWDRTHFICSFPDYSRLSVGMTKTEVEEILGKPSKVVQADDKTQNFYCTGISGLNPHYPQDTQCWSYEFRGWSGTLEVYFNSDERLVGTACGTG